MGNVDIGLLQCRAITQRLVKSTFDTVMTDYLQCKIPQNEARHRLEKYRGTGAFPGPSGADEIHEDLLFQAIALKEDGSPVEIMHTDACKPFLSRLAYRSRPLRRLPLSPRLPPPTPSAPNLLFQSHLHHPTPSNNRRPLQLHPTYISRRPLHPHRHPHRQSSLQPRLLALAKIHIRRLPRHRRLDLELSRHARQRP